MKLGCCATCGDTLQEDARTIYKVEVFCANADCDMFAISFWIDRE